jgi:hypothetical protein
MSYIGKKIRKTKRPIPEPVRPLAPAEPRPVQEPGIAVPNWPIQVPVPVEFPSKVAVEGGR